jgi:hypothetical protein
MEVNGYKATVSKGENVDVEEIKSKGESELRAILL